MRLLTAQLSTLRGRIAVRTAIAVFVALNLAGAAVVVVAVRATTQQVEGVLRAVATSIQLDPTVAGEGETMCASARSRQVVAVPGLTTVFVEVHGPGGTVCRYPGAPALDPLTRPSTPTQWLTGTQLARAWHGGQAILVLEQPLAEGWSVRFGGDLAAVDALAGRLVATLVVVGLIGVAGAVLAGNSVARNGLRPVRALADAAESVTRTQDLSVRIDVRGTAGDDEIDRLVTAFNSMTAALGASRARQAQLIRDAGHELRTPLTSLRANLDLLALSLRSGRPLPDQQRSALLADLTGQVEELARLVDELVLLSRDTPDRPRTPVRLDTVVLRAVERARRRAEGRRVEASLAPWLVCHADAAALERAVVNLLDNAVKFSPPGSVVEVRLADGELTVDDAGPGIAPEHRTEAFERFWRAEDARALPGSGLGLAIVAAVAAAHDGTARLETSPSGGTRAVLDLPGLKPPP